MNAKKHIHVCTFASSIILLFFLGVLPFATAYETSFTGQYTTTPPTQGTAPKIAIMLVPGPQKTQEGQQPVLYVLLQENTAPESAVPVFVPASITEGRLTFSLPPESSSLGTFSGTINHESITGTFSKLPENIVFHRTTKTEAFIQPQDTLAGCYSSLFHHAKSNIWLGHEIIIIPSHKGYYALYQEADEDLFTPFLAPVTIDKTVISFPFPALPEYQDETYFFGRLLGNYLVEISHTPWWPTAIMERKQSFWRQQHPTVPAK